MYRSWPDLSRTSETHVRLLRLHAFLYAFAMPRPQGPRSTVNLSPQARRVLEARGARPDKGHGRHGLTATLDRLLEDHVAALRLSDPRKTHGMTEDEYRLILDALTEPYLEVFAIQHLGDYIAETRTFQEMARKRSIDPAKLQDKLNAYPYIQKLHLVDAAQAHYAPPLPRGGKRS